MGNAPISGLHELTRRKRSLFLVALVTLVALTAVPAFAAEIEDAAAPTTVSIFGDSAAPSTPVDPDPAAVELGTRFQTSVTGTVTAIRFYKSPGGVPGTQVGHLWSPSGRLRASVTFDNETGSGWQEATLDNPVTLRANVPYVVSYFTPFGKYAASVGDFDNAVTNDPLTATAGVYRYGPTSVVPTETWNASNYFVDVVFVPSGSTPPTTTTEPPTTTTEAPTTTTEAPTTTLPSSTSTTTTTTSTTSTTTTTTTLPEPPDTLPPSGPNVVGSGLSAMVFPEAPGLTVSESSLSPYNGPTSFGAGSSGTYNFSNCLVTRPIRIDPSSTVRLTFTNCKIAVSNSDAGYGMIGKGGTLTFIHCLIDGTAYNDYTFPLILEGPGTQTVRFTEFVGNTDQVRSGSGFDFQWNYIHDPKENTATGGAHSDGIEVYYGGGQKTIAHNYISMDGAEGGTSSINLTADFGTIDGATITDNNFLPGGGYSLYVRTDGYCGCGTIRNVSVTGNRWFASNGDRWGGYYGVWSINDMSAISNWTGNVLFRTNGVTVPVTLSSTQP